MATKGKQRSNGTKIEDANQTNAFGIAGVKLPKGNPDKQQQQKNQKQLTLKAKSSNKKLNLTDSDIIDEDHINQRLHQVRQYIRQTSSMLDTIKSSSVNEDDEKVEQIQEMLQRLKEQEKRYLQILLASPFSSERSEMGSIERPVIESSLGRHPDTDMDDDDDTEKGDSVDEVVALREQNELLRQVLERREQLQSLHNRQAALLALKQELGNEETMNIDVESSEGTSQSDNENVVSPANNTATTNSTTGAAATRLNYVRNVGENKNDLEKRLTELQNKKYQMDMLLADLQNLKASTDQGSIRIKNTERNQTTQTQTFSNSACNKIPKKQSAITDKEKKEVLAKMKKLEDVKYKLSELKDLVHFYQGENGCDSVTSSKSDVPSVSLQLDRLRDAEKKLQLLRRTVDEAENGAIGQVEEEEEEACEGDDEDDEQDCDNDDGINEIHKKKQLTDLYQQQEQLMTLENQLQQLNQYLNRVDQVKQRDSPPPPAPNSVTFQEPLPTASNDEVYGRMRQQRILREQLRDQKRVLEDMVRKPKRSSDTRNTRIIQTANDSEVASAAATSVHSATAATWGGSETSARRTAASNGSTHSDDTFVIDSTAPPRPPPPPSSNQQSNNDTKELSKRVDALTHTVNLLQHTNINNSNEHTTATLQLQHVLLAMQHCLNQLSQQQNEVSKSQRQLGKMFAMSRTGNINLENQRVQNSELKPSIISQLNDTTENHSIRETIYSEVATLISLNEVRPHFLLDAVRLLQKFNTDLLRQRALYSLRDLVKEYVNATIRPDMVSVTLENNNDYDQNSTPPFAHDSLGETIINREDISRQARDYRSAKSAGLDTNALDSQVKNIMREAMGAIRAHSNDVCTPEMLHYLEQVVLHSARRYSPTESHSGTIDKQLGRALRDSLAKYNFKPVQECGEDLMVDISELLFNELAFARLLHGLDSTSGVNYTTSTDDGEHTSEVELAEELSELLDSNLEDDKGDSEAEALDRKRDDEMAEKLDEVNDYDDGSDTEDIQNKVGLSYAERKPVTFGSDEDENETEQTNEVVDENDTAVNRDQTQAGGDCNGIITVEDLPKKLEVSVINGELDKPDASLLAGDGDALPSPQ